MSFEPHFEPLREPPAPDLLWPRPKRAECLPERWRPPSPLEVVAGPGVPEPVVERLLARLGRRGFAARRAFETPAAGALRLDLDPAAGLSAQGYRLEVGGRGAFVTASDPAGLAYGAATLAQWIELHLPLDPSAGPEIAGLALNGLVIEDTPDFRHRGVMLDVSRDKVPTLETLFGLVELLAEWKVNQLQLYMEHTFAYRGHEAVWRDASPFTPEDVRRLDAFCRDRFIELVPNQNSFGHFHRWLVHEPYRQLAECPEGVRHPFSDAVEPFSLCPTDPKSLDLLDDLYGQLLPCFTSRQVNVGCDETLDLGLGRSHEACERLGKERVYLDFLVEVYGLLAARGYRTQFWGDIVMERPEMVGELPRDLIALEWGYEADHPFAEHAGRFAASGLPFYVAPGTSSWTSLAGRTENALLNLASAACAGREHGAAGMLVCDWGDFGHMQPLPVAYLGLLAGAGFAWNAAAAAEPLKLDLPALLDRHAFRDSGGVLGRAAYDLGNVYRLAGARPRNGSALFHLLRFAPETLEAERFEGLKEESLEEAEAALAEAAARLAGARSSRPDADLLGREFRWVAETLAFACRFGRARLAAGRARHAAELPAPARRRLAEDLGPLIARHRGLWLERNRPGGVADSCRWLERIVELLA